MPPTATIQLPPLTKQNMSDLIAKAKRMGIKPGDFAKQLIEDSLAGQREAEESTFAQIMKPVREATGEVSDSEITSLVEIARSNNSARTSRKKR